jgi:hypothetical protein
MITLKDGQEEKVNEMIDICKRNIFVINNCDLGTGKTFMSCALIQYVKPKRVIIITPAGLLEDTWLDMKNNYDLPIKKIMSYQSFTGNIRYPPDHGLIEREEYTFYPTDKLIKYINEGVVFIVDEFHRLKNKNTSHNAISCVIKELKKIVVLSEEYNSNMNGNKSRIIFLSGTPFDDVEQIYHFFQMTNIITHDKLYEYDGRSIKFLGLKELINYCNIFDKQKTTKIVNEQKMQKETIKTCLQKLCFTLYIDVLCKYIRCIMKMKCDFKIKFVNGYYKLSDHGQTQLKNGINLIHNNSMNTDDEPFAIENIVKGLKMIQNAKTEIFLRLAIAKLKSDPMAKVMITFDYKEPLYTVFDGLSEYNPILLDGTVHKSKRSALLSKFQENNTDSRVLVANTQICSDGINCDDKFGCYPRYILTNNSFFGMRVKQLFSRCFRIDTKSDVEIVNVQGQCEINETIIINNIIEKFKIMKIVVDDNENNNDFEDYIEQ